MNYCFHGWLNSGPLQDDFIPIEHMPIGPIGSPFLLSTGVVGVLVEVVPLFDSAVLLIVGLSEVLCSLSLLLATGNATTIALLVIAITIVAVVREGCSEWSLVVLGQGYK